MRVKDKTAFLLQPTTKVGIVERIVGTDIAIWAGHVSKYGAVREPDDRALFTHTLMEPHGSAQRLGRVGEISPHDMRVDCGGDAIQVYGRDLPDTELLLVRDR